VGRNVCQHSLRSAILRKREIESNVTVSNHILKKKHELCSGSINPAVFKPIAIGILGPQASHLENMEDRTGLSVYSFHLYELVTVYTLPSSRSVLRIKPNIQHIRMKNSWGKTRHRKQK
jgi:hypothetical protein